jgi:hypothetical protein
LVDALKVFPDESTDIRVLRYSLEGAVVSLIPQLRFFDQHVINIRYPEVRDFR